MEYPLLGVDLKLYVEEVQPDSGLRKERLVYGLLGAEDNRFQEGPVGVCEHLRRVQNQRVGCRRQGVGQLHVEANRSQFACHRGDGYNESLTMRDRSDNPPRPNRLAMGSDRDGLWGQPELGKRLPRTRAASTELGPSTFDRPLDREDLFRIEARLAIGIPDRSRDVGRKDGQEPRPDQSVVSQSDRT